MNKRLSSNRHIIAFFLLVGLVIFINPRPVQAAEATTSDDSLTITNLVRVVNIDREANDLFPLRHDTTLDQAAQLKASDMVAHGYFSHNSPQGVNPWHWFEQANYNYIYAGENLALDFSSTTAVEQAWMNSPKHRENILNSNYEDVGYAIASGTFTDINGIKETRKATVIVQLFGKRDKVAANLRQEPLTNPASDSQIAAAERPLSPVLSLAGVQNILSTALVLENSRPKYWEAYAQGNVLSSSAAKDEAGPDPGIPIIAIGLSVIVAGAHLSRKFI